MKQTITLSILLIFSLMSFLSFSQTLKQKEVIVRKSNQQALEQLKKQAVAENEKQSEAVQNFTNQNNLKVKTRTEDGRLFEIQRIINGVPVYYTTYNTDAARSTRTNFLHANGGLNLNLDGQNLVAHVWDGGVARTTHVEYDGPGGSNRFSVGDATTSLDFHAAHVTGTIIAYGAQADAKGMAPSASAVGYDWNNDYVEALTASQQGMLISNHSYGYAARDQNGNAQLPDYLFGGYIDVSRDWDDLLYNTPYYLMVTAAGNDGNDNTANNAPLDNNGQYDKLTGFKTSKNNLVVANARDAIVNPDGSLSSVSINTSSSEGPTDDLRIKPDITGNGTGVYSTFESSDNDYDSISGTSMASPNVAGSLLLLQEHYNDVNNTFMRAATLKGLALHTADDAGTSGPDAVFGWGLLNAKKAAEVITANGDTSIISELSLSSGQSYQIVVNSNNFDTLQASISWTDLPGTATTNVNDNSPKLINDLDIRITQNNDTFTPWRLTGVTTNGKGDNDRDPYERIDVDNPSGSYTITVTHKGSLATGSQNFSLIVTGLASNAPCVATTPTNVTAVNATHSSAFINWDVIPGAGYEVSFRESGTSTWNTASTNRAEYLLTGLTSSTNYELRVRSVCSSSQSSYSSVITFSTTVVTYCESYGTDQSDEFISRVQFSSIDNSTTAEAGGYGDYTNLIANVDPGSSYPITITPTWNGAAYTEGYAVFIDFNQDGDFDDQDETVYTERNTTGTPASGTITIPSNALSGTTRMRVIMQYDTISTSCETFTYGEVEDYTIAVSTPGCNNISNLQTDAITSDSVTISWLENNSPAGNQWEVVIVNSGAAVPAVGTANVFSIPHTLSNLSQNTSYDIYVRANCASSFQVLNVTTSADWCGASLADSGGTGAEYGDNENQVYTICPNTPGEKVVINFSEFNIENNGSGCYDGLTIYDGDSTSGTIIAPPNGGNAWCWDRNDSPANGSGDLLHTSIAATTTSGCITLVFTSDGSVTRDGFTLSTSCESVVYLWDGTSWTNDPSSSISSSNNLYINDGNTAILNDVAEFNNLYMDDESTLMVNNNTVSIKGNADVNGEIIGEYSIELDANAQQFITGNGSIDHLKANNTSGVELLGTLEIQKSLEVLNGNLNTNNNLVFKSNAQHTAVFNTLGTGASITGEVTVEQFIPAGNRAFRFIGPTVSGSTVFDGWQESGSALSGFGTHITGTAGTIGTVNSTTGLDETASGNPSLFKWISNSQTWDAVSNTKTEQFVPGTFYRIMIRGDRNTDLSNNTAAVTATTLRASGNLHTGSFTSSPTLNTGEFFSMANPYQAKLDLSTVTKSGVGNDMYYWDPTIGPRGTYSTIDMTSGVGTVGNTTQVLEPGQAVFMTATTTNPNVTIEETNKITGSSNAGVFRSNLNSEFVFVKLYQTSRLQANQSESDGLYIEFNDQYDNNINLDDAVKVNGLNANISIDKGSQKLSVERRALPTSDEVVPLHISNYLVTDYTFEISVDDLNGNQVYLRDTYTSQLHPLNMNNRTLINFQISASDNASVDSNRFELVFQNSTLTQGDITNSNALSIYPNPLSSGILNVELNSVEFENAQLSIYDVSGKLVKSEKIDSNKTRVQGLDSIAKGVYLIKVQTSSHNYSAQFIKN
ncbi:S8 family serine peptidase [Nonlabens sp. MIC269]|uniref:S8 family serine peptidase n=1 Tax=Nonlabens sp. MIC269 TaxID=1476901 RepID=UPI0009E7A651|nr:S8 family serine peptidase [Nonlabens sp. MIC269]